MMPLPSGPVYDLLPDPRALWTPFWGDLRPEDYPWFQAKVFTSPDPIQAAVRVHLEIRLLKHKREVCGYRYVLEGRDFVAQGSIGATELKRSPPQVTFQLVFSTIVDEVRGFLYEYDPRLGHIWTRDDPLPNCHLFDPSSVQQIPIICFFCRQPLVAGSAMWGGANVGWAHPECWGKGLPQAR